LKGLYWYFTPIVYIVFRKLQNDGKKGCLKKAISMFGKAREII